MRTQPTPHALAEQLEQLAARLRQHGAAVDRTAPVLASRGFPSTASGANTVHGRSVNVEPDDEQGVTLTATEAAASRRDQFAGIDERWHRLLSASWGLTTGGILLIDQVMAHADPDSAERKVRRPGSGNCSACGRIVAGTENDRLRSGWCDGCRKAWERADRPDRAAFERHRWAEANPPATIHVDPTERWGHGDTHPEQGVVDIQTTAV